MKKCYDHEECEYNANPDCALPDGANCPHGVPTSPLVTNADKFRAKSDEELAEWLCQTLDCDFCKAHMQNIPTYSYCENHESGILKWLQQPAEEEP